MITLITTRTTSGAQALKGPREGGRAPAPRIRSPRSPPPLKIGSRRAEQWGDGSPMSPMRVRERAEPAEGQRGRRYLREVDAVSRGQQSDCSALPTGKNEAHNFDRPTGSLAGARGMFCVVLGSTRSLSDRFRLSDLWRESAGCPSTLSYSNLYPDAQMHGCSRVSARGVGPRPHISSASFR